MHPVVKGFFSLLINQLFHGEPKNRDELLGLIRDSNQKDLIDQDTRDMLEGVLDIAEQRVRDIMIPCSQMITLKRNQNLGRVPQRDYRFRALPLSGHQRRQRPR